MGGKYIQILRACGAQDDDARPIFSKKCCFQKAGAVVILSERAVRPRAKDL